MFTLQAENRNTALKPKQLRRKGIIPGVLYGKDLEESLSIQFSQRDVSRMLNNNSTDSKIELMIGDKKHTTLLREVTYAPVSGEIEHLSFQTLLAGEVVTSITRIVLFNREKIADMVLQSQNEISYRALPSHLIDTTEIDLDGLKVGDSIRVSDLDIAKNPNIEILTPLDTLVLSVTEGRKAAAETENDDAVDSEDTGE